MNLEKGGHPGFGRYLRVYGVQIKNNWVREVVYRANFLTGLAVDFVWILVEASLFTVIYAHTPEIGGWTLHQVYFFLGIFFASDALFTMFFARNFWMFSDLVNKGELDVFLTKPIAPMFLISTRWISITSTFNFVLGVGVMMSYADRAGFTGGWQWFAVAGWLVVGCSTQYLMRFLFCVGVFWTERGFALSRLYYQFFALATKPHVIYPKFIRYAMMTALPFAFIASVPASALMQGISAMELLWVGGVLLVFCAACVVLWKMGLRRYTSASS